LKTKKKIKWFFKFTDEDLISFSKLSGDNHPLHLNKKYAKKKGFKRNIVYGVLLASQISKLIGNKIRKKKIILVSFDINFNKPAYVNELLKFNAELINFSKSTSLMTFKFTIKNPKDLKICHGKAEAIEK
tara:strand:+ start:1119 stop:1508 length:390 start_codon:yes stop_codon:yes gene_type:complete